MKKRVALLMAVLFLLTLIAPFKLTDAKEDQKIKVEGNIKEQNAKSGEYDIPGIEPRLSSFNWDNDTLKVEGDDLKDGYTAGGLKLKLAFHTDENEKTAVDWSLDKDSEYQIYYVFVKAGNGGYLYWYNGNDYNDSGLHGLEKDGGKGYKAISHIQFFFKKKVPNTGSLKVIKKAIVKDGEDSIPHRNVYFQLTSGLPSEANMGTIISTNEQGIAIFDNLAPGKYILNESVPDYYTTSLAPNTEVEIKAGETTLIEVTNTKYGNVKIIKTKSDSCDETEAPSPHSGVGFSLILDENNSLVGTTNENGIIEFPSIPAGKYILREHPTSGYVSSLGKTLEAEIIVRAGITTIVEVNNRRVNEELTSVIGGYKYYDSDEDGYFDIDEKGIKGWTINLYRKYESGGETLIEQQKTDENGAYRFEGLPPGEYRVMEMMPGNWKMTQPNNPDGYIVLIKDIEQIPKRQKNYYEADIGTEIGPLNFGNVQIPEKPILEIIKSDKNSEIKPEDEVTYWITVKNKGNVKAYEVKVFEKLPAYTSFVEGSNPGWTLSKDGYVYDIGTLDVGEVKTILFKVKVDKNISETIKKIDNTAVLSAKDIDDISVSDDTPITPPDLPSTGRENTFSPLMGILSAIFMALGILIKKIK